MEYVFGYEHGLSRKVDARHLLRGHKRCTSGLIALVFTIVTGHMFTNIRAMGEYYI